MNSRPRHSENAGGVPAISRGLSESASDTPPVSGRKIMHPGGVQNRSRPILLRPLRGRDINDRRPGVRQ